MNNIIANTIKYKIDKFVIVIGDEYINIVPENISSFIIYNDYTNAIIPLIKVTFVTSATNIFKVITNKDIVRFYVTMNSYMVDETGKKITLNNSMYRNVFRTYIDENTPDIDKELRDAKYTESEKMNSDVMSIYLYDVNIVEKLYTSYNNIFTNISVFEAMMYYMSKVISNCTLSCDVFDNMDDRHKSMIIPTMTVKDIISYIDSYYGLYDCGSIIFMDTNKQYMLRYDLAKSDKVITIYLYSKLDNKSIKTGMYYDKNNTYIVSDIYNININKMSLSQDLLLGNNIYVVDGENNIVDNINLGKSNRVIHNDTPNKFVKGVIESKVRSMDIEIDLSVTGIDITKLTPDTKIKVVFDNPQLTKEYSNYFYRIASVSAVISGAIEKDINTNIIINSI